MSVWLRLPPDVIATSTDFGKISKIVKTRLIGGFFIKSGQNVYFIYNGLVIKKKSVRLRSYLRALPT